jgi:hypothetical protein
MVQELSDSPELFATESAASDDDSVAAFCDDGGVSISIERLCR